MSGKMGFLRGLSRNHCFGQISYRFSELVENVGGGMEGKEEFPHFLLHHPYEPPPR